jgi:hypothetical protein
MKQELMTRALARKELLEQFDAREMAWFQNFGTAQPAFGVGPFSGCLRSYGKFLTRHSATGLCGQDSFPTEIA